MASATEVGWGVEGGSKTPSLAPPLGQLLFHLEDEDDDDDDVLAGAEPPALRRNQQPRLTTPPPQTGQWLTAAWAHRPVPRAQHTW